MSSHDPTAHPADTTAGPDAERDGASAHHEVPDDVAAPITSDAGDVEWAGDERTVSPVPPSRDDDRTTEAVGWRPERTSDTADEHPLVAETPTPHAHDPHVAVTQDPEEQADLDDADPVPYTGESAAAASDAPLADEMLALSPAEAERRQFLKKVLAISAGTVAVGVPVAAGVRVLLDPLTRHGGGAGGGIPVTIAPLDALPPDGVPRRFQVIANKTDAWNRYPKVPIGAVYLVRNADDVKAFNVVCPHAGCPVDARPDGTFACPCHRSAFHADGSLEAGSVSPRGLDQLEMDKDALSKGQIVVKFQNFMAGTKEKVPVG